MPLAVVDFLQISIVGDILDALLRRDGELGAGVGLLGIFSQQWNRATVHINVEAALSRDRHADYVVGTIIEGPHDWPVRPVSEFFYELDVGEFVTRSGLIGAIWQVKDTVAVDFAVRGARTNDHTVGEIRADVTIAFGVTKGPGLLSVLTAATLVGSH